MEYASSDIRFDVPLADACFEDRQTFCQNVAPGSARVIRCLQDRCDAARNSVIASPHPLCNIALHCDAQSKDRFARKLSIEPHQRSVCIASCL